MSDPKSTPGFPELQDDGLDINAIFGSSDAPADPLPFPMEPKPTDASPKASDTPTEETATHPLGVPAPQTVTVDKAEPSQKTEATAEDAPDLFAAFADDSSAPPAPVAGTAPVPTGGKQMSLFDRPPVFKYGGAKESIEDTSMTFEELRIKKSEDFPELEEGKKVSWSVKYGNETKSVTDPKSTTIAKIKEEIETSKSFLDSLKKGKVKDPECFLIPTVRAQSKGITSAYKGVFPTVEAARASDKIICLIPTRDGKVFELRKTEMGEVIAPKNNVVDFEEVRAGFNPALPLIPRELLGQIISFFRSVMGKDAEYEALVNIYWDREDECFVAMVPPQKVGKAMVTTNLDDTMTEDRYYHYADIHSHNSMAAKFSAIDDADEKATRLYMVVGLLDHFYPQLTARVSCGGTFVEIDPGLVVEGVGEEFPPEWLDQVEKVTQEKYERSTGTYGKPFPEFWRSQR